MALKHRLNPRAVAALVIVIISLLYLAAARGYRLGAPSNPGAGMFPLILGVALLVAAATMLAVEMAASRRQPGYASADHPKEPFASRRLLWFGAVAVLYPVAIAAVGFEAATVIGLGGAAYVLGERRPARIGLLALLGAAAGHLVFRRLLGVPLP